VIPLRIMKFIVIAEKGFQQNFVYLASHGINTVASAVFGLIYISLWRSVVPPSGFGDYSQVTIAQYIAFNQVILWFVQFGIRMHVRISQAVRTGNIAEELLRPVSYFWYRMSQEAGVITYNLLFRGIPVGLLLAFVSFHIPRNPFVWLWSIVAVALAGYIGLVLYYLVGITSFWATEIRTAYWVVANLSLGLGGASMPLEVLPDAVEKVARLSPFACLCYYPARIYLGLSGPDLIWYSVFWSIALTLLAQFATGRARARLEVQGG
jgi:ABC-2 type transport system permease protein